MDPRQKGLPEDALIYVIDGYNGPSNIGDESYD